MSMVDLTKVNGVRVVLEANRPAMVFCQKCGGLKATDRPVMWGGAVCRCFDSEPLPQPFKGGPRIPWMRPVSAPAPWECPRCKVVNAPHVDRCSCSLEAV